MNDNKETLTREELEIKRLEELKKQQCVSLNEIAVPGASNTILND